MDVFPVQQAVEYNRAGDAFLYFGTMPLEQASTLARVGFERITKKSAWAGILAIAQVFRAR